MPLRPQIPLSSLLSRIRILRSSSSIPRLPIPRAIRAWKKPLLIFAKCALLYHLTTNYLGHISSTQGISMMPTIPHSYTRTAPRILISSLHRRGRNIGVGDVITFTNPVMPSTLGCKRVIGMPGDYVCVVTPGKESEDLHKGKEEGDWATVKEEMVQVPQGHCWVAGDNLDWSRDSRLFGPLPLGLVKGKVLAVVWPWGDAKWLGAGRDVVDAKEGEREWVSR